MIPYQERVKMERAELDEKIQKLAVFLDSPIYYGLPEDERGRLARQLTHMNNYREVLDERIGSFV